MSNLPKGWEEVNFDNFFKTISAKKYQIQKKDYLQKSIYPVIDQGQKFIIAYSNQSDKLLKNSSGLIIFGDHTRIIKFIDFDFIVGADGTQILDTKSNVDIKFAYYTLLFKEIVSLGYSRHFKIIKEFNYLVPPLEEQKKITDILSTVDKKIAFVEENINVTEELKKGLMQKLLTEGIGHTEFKDSELGRIPQSWEIKLLDSLAKRGSGHTPNKQILNYWNGGIKWVSLSDSNKMDNRYIYFTSKEISLEGIKNSSAVIHPKETVILVRDAGVGKSAILGYDMAVSQHFMAWTCGDFLNNIFLYYWLQFKKSVFESIAIGSTIKTIGLEYFKKLKIPVPQIGEQKQIAEILSTVDKKLENLKEKKESFEELKKGLMQKLLTGEVRV